MSDERYGSCCFLCVGCGHLQCLVWLVEVAGADPSVQCKGSGRQPSHYAVSRLMPLIAKLTYTLIYSLTKFDSVRIHVPLTHLMSVIWSCDSLCHLLVLLLLLWLMSE